MRNYRFFISPEASSLDLANKSIRVSDPELIHKIKEDVKRQVPEVKHIQVELETP